jgi:hypothetical protein
MKKSIIAKTGMDESIAELVSRTSHRTLAIWAADCAERVLPYFEERYPEDRRPREAIEAARTWAETGVFKMADVRRTSLAAHAAARLVEDYHPARSAARAAGHAIATAHVPRHAIGAALYATTAVRDAASPSGAGAATISERTWQYHHLLELAEIPGPA